MSINSNHSSSRILGARQYLISPSFPILYDTQIGISFDMEKVTWFDKLAAFENMCKYLEAKLCETGSSTLRITTQFSFPVSCWLKVVFPVPIYPVMENLTHSLLVQILIDSASPKNSLQIRAYSLEGIVHIERYSESGSPKLFSVSRVINDKLNSEILSPSTYQHCLLLDSNLNLSQLGSSLQDNVRLSSLPAIFKILDTFSMLIPRVKGL